MVSNENVKWIESVLVPRIKDRDAIVEKCSITALEIMKDNWASMMFEVDLSLIHHSRKKSMSLLVKLEHDDKLKREGMKSDQQFSNEVHLYSVALPTLLSRVSNEDLKSELANLVPKSYYSYILKDKEHTSARDGILVMENLKLKGYKLGNRTFLDLEHCILAMQRIGMFHALSYFLKERDPGALKKIVEPIIETNYQTEEREIITTKFGESELRVINALAEQLPQSDAGLARLRAISEREAFDVYVDLVNPREPLAVFCHGDFLRNNVLFQYKDGAPIDMKLVDFQTIRYASPAIDLSLLICMNTSHELRSEHLLRILQEYNNSVRRTLAALLEVNEEQLPSHYSFDAFMKDFRQHALYGYLITIEFLPWMLAGEKELEEFLHLKWTEMASPRYIECWKKLGGSNATQVLVDLANDLIAHECL